jgi:uncharacterized protein YegP (UPF0339 family)
MAKQQKPTGARVEYWKNKKGEFNYRLIGRNGRIIASVNQGFKRRAGIEKNLHSLDVFFHNIPFDEKIFEINVKSRKHRAKRTA